MAPWRRIFESWATNISSSCGWLGRAEWHQFPHLTRALGVETERKVRKRIQNCVPFAQRSSKDEYEILQISTRKNRHNYCESFDGHHRTFGIVRRVEEAMLHWRREETQILSKLHAIELSSRMFCQLHIKEVRMCPSHDAKIESGENLRREPARLFLRRETRHDDPHHGKELEVKSKLCSAWQNCMRMPSSLHKSRIWGKN